MSIVLSLYLVGITIKFFKGNDMQTIKLEIEDSKLDIVLNIINSLKDDVVTRYEIITDKKESKDFINISQQSLENIWDNEEDSIYDKFL